MSLQNQLYLFQPHPLYRRQLFPTSKTLSHLIRPLAMVDHYINVLRGAEAITGISGELLPLPPDEALNKIAMKLLSTVGGAAGPLFASFFMGMAKVTKHNGGNTNLDIAAAFAGGVQELIKRGKGKIGEKNNVRCIDSCSPHLYLQCH